MIAVLHPRNFHDRRFGIVAAKKRKSRPERSDEEKGADGSIEESKAKHLMRNLLERLRWKMSIWLEGRHGADNLSSSLTMIGLALILIYLFTGFDLLWALGMGLFIYATFRTFSKNLSQREAENEGWLRLVGKPRAAFSLAQKAWQNRATTSYFKCRGCGQVLSVPKGKGKLRVTCPKCGTQTERKS